MAMTKKGYITAYAGKATEKVDFNADGTISQSGESPDHTKRVTMPGLNPDNDLETNHSVYEFFFGIVGGYSDQSSNKFTVTWEALG